MLSLTKKSKENKDNKESARSCLIASACRLFAKLGLDKTSTRDIAQDSNVNISMISYHFGGKEGLYKQVLQDFAEAITKNIVLIEQKFISIDMTKNSFKEEMSDIIDNMIRTRIENPEICTLLSREKIEGMPLSREIHEKIFYPLVQKFLAIIDKAQKKKIVRTDINPTLFFILMTEGLFGFFEMAACKTQLSNHYEDLVSDPVQLRNQIIKIYLEGIIL